MRPIFFALALASGLLAWPGEAEAQYGDPSGVHGPGAAAFGQRWGHTFVGRDYQRFYHYPYVYYPQNFWSHEYYRSRNHLVYRYPPEMRIPVYNRQWFNYYPQYRKYHRGHHFILDVF